MSRRATLITFALGALLVLGGLLAAAASDRRATAFAPGVPDNLPVASLDPGQSLCQGPVPVPASFDALQVWAYPAPTLDVQIRRAPGGALLSARRVAVPASLTGRLTVPLGTAAIRPGARITVCLRDAGPRPVEFEGGPPTTGSGRLTVSGQRSPNAIALLFLRGRPPSLLSLLPAVFQRAGLFKLDGVGAWTFWLLGAAVLLAFVLAALALSTAVGQGGAGQEDRGA